ncbi:MAG: hypothetical protein ACYS0C_01540 [Planctomycetota bacterium]|jgi:hypothetical protein
MARVIVIIGVCFLATVCFAQQEYSNSKWHFSLTLPGSWKVITDDMLLSEYTEELEIRFEDIEILALCQEVGGEDEKNSILIQAQSIGEAREGLVLEALYEERLRSDYNWELGKSYLEGFRGSLVEKGQVAKKAKYKSQIYYDSDRHIFFEKIMLPRRRWGAIGMSMVRLLGNNRITILSFNLYGEDSEELFGLLEEVVDSFTYDEHYGFGEATGTDVGKILWHWLFPGFGTIIVAFLVYKWVASEYR